MIVTTASIQKKDQLKQKKRPFDLKIMKWNCHNQMTALMFPFFPLKLYEPVFRSYQQEGKSQRVGSHFVLNARSIKFIHRWIV